MPNHRLEPRCAPAVVVAVGVLLLLPGGALANNDNYACELTPSAGLVKHIFGLPHAAKRKAGGGGTDEEVGAFTSHCVVYAFKKPAKKGVNPLGRPSNRFRVRKGFALLDVAATVQDDGEAGDNWNPDRISSYYGEDELGLIREFGGSTSSGQGFWSWLTLPSFGSSRFQSGLAWGSNLNNSQAHWQDGDEGVIFVKVDEHGESKLPLKKFAKLIVPRFKP